MRRSSIHSAERNTEPSVDLKIRQAQKRVGDYLQAKGEAWTQLNNHFRHVTFLVEEVGELARAVINAEAKTGDPSRRGLDQSRKAKLDAIRDALGDALYHLMGLAVAYRIDLQRAFQNSMRTIERRYPVTRSRKL